ncbi:hypothetical protein EG68_08117 [Paragonimus skrjabini miyazakii]|uniref:Uncharacterized protein n=1 Tax=Paragonimus skrjabini miyazakii TaxID=59628 RepID=A0A8S9YSE5_9TREM|nr:hypothetical protein EG68_08117 [Paragonimus skrjabini miyazakii]
MSAVRPSGTAQSRVVNQQIWPAIFDDTSNSVNPQEVWDDSELVAHYDRVDAFVKQKLNAIYAERTGRSPVRHSVRTKPRSASQVHHPSRDPSRNSHTQCGPGISPRRFSITTSASRQHPGDSPQVGHHQPNTLHGLEAALQSSRPSNTLSCDFEWLPPMLHPPDELFDPKLSTTRPPKDSAEAYTAELRSVMQPNHFVVLCVAHSFGTISRREFKANDSGLLRSASIHRSRSHTRILPRDKRYPSVAPSTVGQLPDGVLQRWFEAGYNLGREHALQQMKQSSPSTSHPSNIPS